MAETFHKYDVGYQGSMTRGNGSSVSHSASQILSWKDSLAGESVPGWRRAVRMGLDATSPYSAVKGTVDLRPMNLSSQRVGAPEPNSSTPYRLNVSGFPDAVAFTVMNAGAGMVTQAHNSASGDFYNSVSDAHSEFKGAVAALELPKTSGMISSKVNAARLIVTDYVNEARRLKKLFLRNPKKGAAALRKLYLEYTYGWAPLLSDVGNLCDEMTKAQNIRVGVSGVGTSTYSRSPVVTDSFWLYSSIGNYRKTDRADLEFSVRYKGSLILVLGTKSSGPKRPSLGFNPEEFLPTAYELFPFSFVIDYVANVGDLITAYAYADAKFQYVFKNTRTISKRIVEYTATPYPGGIGGKATNSTGSGGYTATYRVQTRSKVPHNTVPLPGLQFNTEVNEKQYLNVMVLFQQLASRGARL